MSIINPKVHRALYNFSIKRFIEEKVEDISQYIVDSNIDVNNELGYSKLLDYLINERVIGNQEIDDFLINELNYGRSRNVFVSFIQETSHLKNNNDIIKFIKKLESKGYKNAELVKDEFFVGDIRRGIPVGEEELVWSCIDKNTSGNPCNIRLLLAKGDIDIEDNEQNYYIGVEINLEYNFLVVKLRNWENQNYSLDTLHKSIQDDIKKAFNLVIPLLSATSKEIVYNIINDLSTKVLQKAISTVDETLKNKVRESLKEWTDNLLTEEVVLPDAEYDVLTQSILNSYYRIYMQNEYGVIKVKELKNQFGVNGYPRYVKFTDDTIGEARAKSSDPKESLLDTSIYYDVKARLDQAKIINMATVYWIDSPTYEYLGTTFYTDNHERFKFIVLPNFFDKGICDYVLRQINENYPGRSE